MLARWSVSPCDPQGFLASLLLVADVEELVLDRTVWHERGWLFGGPLESVGLTGRRRVGAC